MSVVNLAEVRRRFLLATEQMHTADADALLSTVQASGCACAACGDSAPLVMSGTMRHPSGRLYAYGVCAPCYQHIDVETLTADMIAAFDGP